MVPRVKPSIFVLLICLRLELENDRFEFVLKRVLPLQFVEIHEYIAVHISDQRCVLGTVAHMVTTRFAPQLLHGHYHAFAMASYLLMLLLRWCSTSPSIRWICFSTSFCRPSDRRGHYGDGIATAVGISTSGCAQIPLVDFGCCGKRTLHVGIGGTVAVLDSWCSTAAITLLGQRGWKI